MVSATSYSSCWTHNAVTAIPMVSKQQVKHFAQGLYYRKFLIIFNHLGVLLVCTVYPIDFAHK